MDINRRVERSRNLLAVRARARLRDPVLERKGQDLVDDVSFRVNDLTLIAYKDVVIG